MTDRKRSPLPEDYQFGDARPVTPGRLFHRGAFPFVWRRPSENAAAQLKARANPDTWNDVLDALPRFPMRKYRDVTDPVTGHTSRVFEPSRFIPFEHWNVIEGEKH